MERTLRRPQVDAFEAGLMLGLLVCDGHFGGDGKQAQVTLKMHVRHEPLLRWVNGRFPYARLYGPYRYGARNFFQLMWRGTQLQYGLMPWLESTAWSEIDPHSYARYAAMKERYRLTDVPLYARPTFEGSLLPAWEPAAPPVAHEEPEGEEQSATEAVAETRAADRA